jgi:hypothetical protein
MKYTRINGLGLRDIVDGIEWEGDLYKMADIFEEVLIESGFKLDANISKDQWKYYRMGQSPYVEVVCVLLDLDYHISIWYESLNGSKVESCKYMAVHQYTDEGDKYSFHRYGDDMENLKADISGMFNRILEDVRKAWYISVKCVKGGLL